MTEKWKFFSLIVTMTDTPGQKEPQVQEQWYNGDLLSNSTFNGLVDQALPSFKAVINNSISPSVVADWGIPPPLACVAFPLAWMSNQPVSSFGYSVDTKLEHLKVVSLTRLMNKDGGETSVYTITYFWNSEHIAYTLRENLEMQD